MYDLSSPLHPASIVLQTLDDHMNGGHDWVFSTLGYDTNNTSSDWCAYTVTAVGIATKLSGVIFPKKGQPGIGYAGMCAKAFEAYGGVRYDGPFWGVKSFTPTKGDIIVFVWRGSSFYNTVKNLQGDYGKYSASHIGIVEYYKDGVVHTIEGNVGGSGNRKNNAIKRCTRKVGDDQISFYVRPNWAKGDGVVAYSAPTTGTYDPSAVETISTTLTDGVYSTQLYTTESTKADASIREVAYLGNDGKPSITMSGVRLSVINYTGLLNNLNKLIVGSTGLTEEGTTDNIDGLQSKPRTIVEYLKNKGFNTAAAIGIIANIEYESNFKTNAVQDGGTSFGLCRWPTTRGYAMMQYLKGDWKNNLSGQLDYLLLELNSSYTSLLSELKAVPNTLEGAKRAADRFLRLFEQPTSAIDSVSKKRQTAAQNYWAQIVTTTAASRADYSSNPTVQKAPMAVPGYLTWPLPNVAVGKYSSPFGYRGNIGVNGATKYHSGVDMGSPEGTEIHCCAAGILHYKDYTSARGNLVVVDHGNQFYTLYQHMKSQSPISVGTKVLAGQVIGYVGHTGVGSNHLHLETQIGGKGKLDGQWYDESYQSWRNKYCVDPAQFFPKLGSSS